MSYSPLARNIKKEDISVLADMSSFWVKLMLFTPKQPCSEAYATHSKFHRFAFRRSDI